MALDKLVEAEVKRMRERAQSGQTTPLEELSLTSSTAASATGARVLSIPKASDPAAEDEGRPPLPNRMAASASMPALTLPPTFLPVVPSARHGWSDAGSIHSQDIYSARQTSRKSTGINMPKQYSDKPSLFAMTRAVGHNVKKAEALRRRPLGVSSSTSALPASNANKQT